MFKLSGGEKKKAREDCGGSTTRNHETLDEDDLK